MKLVVGIFNLLLALVCIFGAVVCIRNADVLQAVGLCVFTVVLGYFGIKGILDAKRN